MTIEQAVALLRDAREWLGHGLPCATICGECIVIDRIDAALAAHDAIPPSEEPVEWVSLCDGQENRLRLADGTRLYVCSHGDGHWGWSVNRPSSYGYADTLDEAQRAAIAAARGLK